MPDTSTALHSAFDAWCAHQRQAGRLRRATSVTVYQAMWAALVGWLRAQPGADGQRGLHGLDAAHLQRYLASRHGMAGPDAALTARYRLRLLSLVRRVQSHDLARRDALAVAVSSVHAAHRQRGAAALAWSEAHLAGGPPLALAPPDAPCSLSAAAIDSLLAWLGGTTPATATAKATRPSPATAPSTPAPGTDAPPWRVLRNRCALALQLGAGLGPGDLRALRLSDVLAPAAASTPAPPNAGWWLRVPANGNAPAYPAPVAAWAATLLQQWLACRNAHRLPGPWLLPATGSGKPWGKVAQYSAALQALALAGVPDGPGGSFRLRHSFALRQLLQGHDADTVAGWLGISDPAVMQRYRQALGAALIDHAAHGRHPDPSANASPAGAARPALPWPV